MRKSFFCAVVLFFAAQIAFAGPPHVLMGTALKVSRLAPGASEIKVIGSLDQDFENDTLEVFAQAGTGGWVINVGGHAGVWGPGPYYLRFQDLVNGKTVYDTAMLTSAGVDVHGVVAVDDHEVQGVARNRDGSLPSTGEEIQITGWPVSHPDDTISVFASDVDGSWTIPFLDHTNRWDQGDLYRFKGENVNQDSPFYGDAKEFTIALSSNPIDDTGDTTLPVELSLFTARMSPDGIKLRWRTESEVNNIGFNVYRSKKIFGPFSKIAFVDGAGNSAMPIDYQFTDKKAEAGKTYFYYLEDIDIAGEKSKSAFLKVVAVKLTATTLGRIKGRR